MELHRYDVILTEIKVGEGSHIEEKIRPYVIISNEMATTKGGIIIIVPLTHIIKKMYLPVHDCIEAGNDNGLSTHSMILGEQPQTIDTDKVICKLGTLKRKKHRNAVNRVCYNALFFGENINWSEVLK